MKALLQESVERAASALSVGLDLPQQHQFSWMQAKLAIKLGASLDEVQPLSSHIAEYDEKRISTLQCRLSCQHPPHVYIKYNSRSLLQNMRQTCIMQIAWRTEAFSHLLNCRCWLDVDNATDI